MSILHFHYEPIEDGLEVSIQPAKSTEKKSDDGWTVVKPKKSKSKSEKATPEKSQEEPQEKSQEKWLYVSFDKQVYRKFLAFLCQTLQTDPTTTRFSFDGNCNLFEVVKSAVIKQRKNTVTMSIPEMKRVYDTFDWKPKLQDFGALRDNFYYGSGMNVEISATVEEVHQILNLPEGLHFWDDFQRPIDLDDEYEQSHSEQSELDKQMETTGVLTKSHILVRKQKSMAVMDAILKLI